MDVDEIISSLSDSERETLLTRLEAEVHMEPGQQLEDRVSRLRSAMGGTPQNAARPGTGPERIGHVEDLPATCITIATCADGDRRRMIRGKSLWLAPGRLAAS